MGLISSTNIHAILVPFTHKHLHAPTEPQVTVIIRLAFPITTINYGLTLFHDILNQFHQCSVSFENVLALLFNLVLLLNKTFGKGLYALEKLDSG